MKADTVLFLLLLPVFPLFRVVSSVRYLRIFSLLINIISGLFGKESGCNFLHVRDYYSQSNQSSLTLID